MRQATGRISVVARRSAAVLAVVVGICGVLPAGPSASAAPPAVTVTPARGAPGTTYVVSVACPTQPTITLIDEDSDVPGGATPVEGPAGTWTASLTAGQADTSIDATCAGESAPAHFDADFPRMGFGPQTVPPHEITDPTRVDGTDCPDGTTAAVRFTRDGLSTDHTAPIDGDGDWTIALPASVATEGITVDASCGSVTYDQITFVPPTSFARLSELQGRPGDSYDVEVRCPVQPTGTVTIQFQDTVVPVRFAADGPGRWRLPARVKDGDAHYEIQCDGDTQRLVFDALTLDMRFTPILGAVPTGVAGTDCSEPEGVVVQFYVGFRPVQEATPAIGAYGTWEVDLPPDADRLGVIVNATCGAGEGAFAYETLHHNVFDGFPPSDPGDPREPSPAVALPGGPTFTG